VPARKTEPKGELFVAKDGFACDLKGEMFIVAKGERVREGHPLLRSHADYFEPADVSARFAPPEVEQATAAPGEKRGG